MAYIIGIDTGTSNTKAVALSAEGKILAEASVPYTTLDLAEEGYNEHDPELLFEAMINAVSDIVGQLGDEHLKGISFSSAMHSLMVVDQSGNALTNLITWADNRSAEYARNLRHGADGIVIATRTGTPIHPMSPLCKIMWLRDHQPAIFKAAHKFISIKEYFFFKLFGRYIIDHSIASATGLFDIYLFHWNDKALQLAGISKEQLSDPVSTDTQIFGMKPEYLRRLRLNNEVPVIAGGSDGCMANLGSNAISPGDVALTIGTSGAVRMVVDKPFNSEGKLFNYILSTNRYIGGGAVNNGGILLQWYAENFLNRSLAEASDFGWFVEKAMTVPAGCEDLIFLPYVNGERAPIWNADAKGVFFGIRSMHTQAHFMRAIVEGICYALYQVTRELENRIHPVKNIMASGGFIKSDAWLQILSDIFNTTIQVQNASDASAVGAAIIGLKSTANLRSLEDASAYFTSGKTIHPDPLQHSIYIKNFKVYEQLYERLKDLY